MAEVQTFTDTYTISDGNQIIELYHVEGFNHSDNMTIVYLLKAKIVINADMYGPPAAGGTLPAVSANAVALYRNIKRLNLVWRNTCRSTATPARRPTSSESWARLLPGPRKWAAAGSRTTLGKDNPPGRSGSDYRRLRIDRRYVVSGRRQYDRRAMREHAPCGRGVGPRVRGLGKVPVARPDSFRRY
jgi:hypothetical protein